MAVSSLPLVLIALSSSQTAETETTTKIHSGEAELWGVLGEKR
ncbi:MAG: hypothetical protein AAGE84_06230 [Cyanobacteria bacterium P01_G01_bin.39]